MNVALHKVALCLLLLSATPILGVAGGEEFTLVAFQELLDDGHSYDGKMVAVIGYYVMVAPDSVLYGDKPTGKNYHGHMLWVAGSEPEGSAGIVRKNGSWAIVIGRYRNERLGIFGKYFGQIDRIIAMYPIEVQNERK